MLATSDKKRATILRLLILTIALVSVTSCQLAERFMSESGPEPATFPGPPTVVSPDESPRLMDSQELPPTWTPAVQQRDQAPPVPDEVAPVSTDQASYVVQSGDTLAEIALQFNVSIEELARVNGIEDFDHIEVGQVLVIPGN